MTSENRNYGIGVLKQRRDNLKDWIAKAKERIEQNQKEIVAKVEWGRHEQQQMLENERHLVEIVDLLETLTMGQPCEKCGK